MIITLVGAGNAVIQSVPAIFKGDPGDPGDGGSGGSATWETLTGKPTTFTPSTHAHAITEVTGLQAVLDDKSDILHDHSWEEVTNKPVSFNPTSHNHNIDEVTGLQTALDGKSATTHTHTYASITDKPTTFAPSAHTHVIADTTGLQAALDAKQPTTTFKTINNETIVGTGNISITGSGGGTSYNDEELRGRIVTLENEPDITWTTLIGKPTTFTPSTHNHVIADTTGLQAALDGKAATSHTHTYDSITGKPTTFTPSAHTHVISEVTGLQAALDSKAATSHTHSIANVTGLQTALDGKQATTSFRTVNGQAITGAGNVVTSISFDTDAEAIAYSNANPGVTVGSRQV